MGEPSPRQRQILEMVADGFSYREISEKLCLERNTIHFYAKNLLKKLDANNIAHAVSIGFREGILV
jgi:DNA-binding NarL/FixJ family response regulator